MRLPSKEKFMSHFHLWKSVVNKITKWKLFSIQRYQIINFDTLFIGVDMIWTNTIENYLNTCQMPWKKWEKMINDIQTNPRPSFFMNVVRIHIVIQHTLLTYHIHIHTQTHNMDENIHKYSCTTIENVMRKIYYHKTHDANTYSQAKPIPLRESRLMLIGYHSLELH